jgi:hypothetical protein
LNAEVPDPRIHDGLLQAGAHGGTLPPGAVVVAVVVAVVATVVVEAVTEQLRSAKATTFSAVPGWLVSAAHDPAMTDW